MALLRSLSLVAVACAPVLIQTSGILMMQLLPQTLNVAVAGSCRKSQVMHVAPKRSLVNPSTVRVLPSSSHACRGRLITHCHTVDLNIRVQSPCKFLSSLFSPFLPCLGYPGEGPVDVLSINVTSLRKRRHDLFRIQDIVSSGICVQCVCLQETRIPTSSFNQFKPSLTSTAGNFTSASNPNLNQLKHALLPRDWGMGD